ncbi:MULTISPECIES: ABC transporter ATP-binding protein [Paenibacillus]|uniref:Amino acid ABC transporter ATPase n=1 Tax=Paenibacillus naphthalenovorans TaxID=162209 RepID=A0A0U2L0E6_9BACL|nr:MULTISPECIES: ABC transporter ATP-binding protein [Paenibacillus]ALS22946.1 amino acid ABC transporter ATPase [Paenibacillus naphthalenovorans]SDI44538.1 branched-chain amino acid transport system ATP-binding protein [Paenibacillus naphthalenovorans]
MLRLNGIETRYGEIVALRNVSLEIREGEIVALLGMNGAGKSTTLKTISGLIRPKTGTIEFMGQPIDHIAPEEIVRRGLVHVPEGRKIFPGLTVRENLILGATGRKVPMHIVNQDIEEITQIFPDLIPLMDRLGWSLSGGQQQMCAIGRGLMAKPKLLLLDEPSLGLAPVIVQNMFQAIKQINQSGTTVLLVEQNARQSLAISHRGYVLEAGRIVANDDASKLLDEIKNAYLGAH